MSIPAIDDVLAGQTRPLRRDEYDRLVHSGAFEDERIELLDGKLVFMAPQGTFHAWVIQNLNPLLIAAVGSSAIVRVQSPYGLSDVSEPEPDFAIVPNDDYLHAHPERALLLIEVSESSLRKDQLVKSALYAGGVVEEYWIVDIPHRRVLVAREPVEGTYSDVRAYGREETITALHVEGLTLTVADFMPA